MSLLIMILCAFIGLQRRNSVSAVFCRKALGSTLSLSKHVPVRSSTISYRLFSSIDSILDSEKVTFDSLRGSPEMMDRLQFLCHRYPGIEHNVNLYKALYSFPLDRFQLEGLTALTTGKNVVVMTPTGSGKTLVGELAIYYAVMKGLRVVYTTPLKALSNQKFADFKAKYGADRVGLMTGDLAVNRGSQITVMTTEVLRNILYDPSSLSQYSDLFMVVFDEFHFMNDPDRGSVWEESVIACPSHVRILALSATMGNANEIVSWISHIHGETTLVQHSNRPVPLRYFYAIKNGLHPLFRDPQAGPGAPNGVKKESVGSSINPSVLKLEELAKKTNRMGSFKQRRSQTNIFIPKYSDIIEELQSLDKLPCIVFIFSRMGCEDAARMLQNTRIQLLNPAEQATMKTHIQNYLQNNPDIPIPKHVLYTLQRGIGVHHAGLISVYKGFIEDLFGAGLIKVLFATETLAAGVNMPARTTVITSVTKRINGNVVSLKPSQLLQMAGRAGRRGKDVEGSVVLMKNKYDDVKMAHSILCSKVDSIKSHFRCAYSLTVKLLQTKGMDECQALIQRGFSAYMVQKKIKKRENKQDAASRFRDIILRYSLPTLREFSKLLKQSKQAQQNLDYLVQQVQRTEQEVMESVIDYMPMGTGVLLVGGEVAYFLGDVKMKGGKAFSSSTNDIYGREAYALTDEDYEEESSTDGVNPGNVKRSKLQQMMQSFIEKKKEKVMRGYGVVTQRGRVLIVQKEHIRMFANNPDDGLLPHAAQRLLDLIHLSPAWQETPMENCKEPLYVSSIDATNIDKHVQDEDIYALLEEIVSSSRVISAANAPYSILKQKAIVENLQKEIQNHEVTVNNDTQIVLQALDYLKTLKDPSSFLSDPTYTNNSVTELYAWKMFLSVIKVLDHYEALNNGSATPLGHMVSSFSSDNELWLALVLSQPHLHNLTYAEFGALMAALNVEPYKVENAYFKVPTSMPVQLAAEELGPLYTELSSLQDRNGIDFPIFLSPEICGIAEMWAKGATWRDLCASTSLDQGDLCRILKRTVEILKQIPNAFYVSEDLVQKAEMALRAMDRFPIAEQVAALEPGLGSGVTVSGDEDLLDERDLDDERAGFDVNLEDIDGLSGGVDELFEMLEEDPNSLEAMEEVEVTEESVSTPSASSSSRGKGFSIIGSVPGSLEDLDRLIAQAARHAGGKIDRPEAAKAAKKKAKKGKSNAKVSGRNWTLESEVEIEQRVAESDHDLDVIEHNAVRDVGRAP